MKASRGVSLLMVLIVLGVGALVLVPTLNYASTAVNLFKVSRNDVSAQYALDAITGQSLWMLQYLTLFKDCDSPTDGLVDSFADCVAKRGSWTLATPGKLTGVFNETQVEKLNGQEVTVKVEVPGALTAAPPPTPTPAPGQCFYTSLTRDTDPTIPGDQSWVRVNQPVTYTLWVSSCSTSGASVNLRRIVVLLQQPFNYVTGSANVVGNMTLSEPSPVDYRCTGAALDGPAGPYYGCLANDSALLLDWPSGTTNFAGGTAITLKAGDPPIKEVFKATPTSYGVFYVEPLVCYFAATSGNLGPCAGGNGIRGGKQAPVVVGLFNIQGKALGHAFGATAKLDSSGSQLISVQPN